ncbi:DNA recombination/repair protein RecA/RadB, ATP-binding domain protein [Beauveria brongniartii RCEF 3172]|uniref:DNA recombination/repair protein RecA/RadB, ATP-binding domain protein n=1 Tax=Beauveria brongniartii RCEF 3172 TaxID=1081107 RepID=A0A167C4P0_9HYPO|nr:DNA recombination/repair protein RecA/RadB, ATP-binding domain protein [Beauveria brongniartii RCEF 3172]
MDYYSIHGNDIASFDIANTHRLPTVSASQVLEELEEGSDCISTGIKALDETLVSLPAPSQIYGREKFQSGGIRRGQVTEIWGPPGSGKTALATQLAANALNKEGGAVWIDCFQKTPDERLSAALEKIQLGKETPAIDPASTEKASNGDNFTQYSCFTLPHFLALLSRPSSTTIPAGTSLIVVNCVSALINSALPRSHVSKQKTKQPPGTTPSEKRMLALQTIMSLLNKLAATRNCAVVILSQCATKMQSEHGAALVPAVNATVWEQGISTRIALFRNWSWEGRKPHSVFLAGVQQVDGRAMMDVVGNASAFTVESMGVRGVEYEASHPMEMAAAAQQKRKIGQTELEVPDSEDEDYGWANEDEASLPAPPPQWQGSEDIILGQDVGRSEDEEEAEEEYHSYDETEGAKDVEDAKSSPHE